MCSFILPNRRQDLQFAYMRGNTLVSTSPVLANDAPNLPGGVKVVPDADAGSVTVQWQTLDASQPQVLWGTDPAALSSTTAATTGTYTKADITAACSQGVLSAPLPGFTSVFQGWTDPNQIHVARLAGLQPDTTYHYRVEDGGAASDPLTRSPILSFTTPPAPDSDASWVWLMAADVGQAQEDGSSTVVAIKPGALGVSPRVIAAQARCKPPFPMHGYLCI